MPCTFPALRISQKSNTRNRIVGPNPSSRFCHHGAPVSSGSAFTTTPLLWRSCESALLSANAGISVRNRVVGFAFPYRSFCVNVPWIAVPFDVISSTRPAVTCCRKNGLYGTRTREGACVAREPAQKLTARRASTKTIHLTPKRGRHEGGVGEGADGAGGLGGLAGLSWLPPFGVCSSATCSP